MNDEVNAAAERYRVGRDTPHLGPASCAIYSHRESDLRILADAYLALAEQTLPYFGIGLLRGTTFAAAVDAAIAKEAKQPLQPVRNGLRAWRRD